MNLSTNTTDDGQVYYEPAKKREDSQNNILGNILINYLYAVDSVINNEGYNLKDDEVVNSVSNERFQIKTTCRYWCRRRNSIRFPTTVKVLLLLQ